MVVDVRHTADVERETLVAARALLYEVFDDMTEADWEHCLGGVHALAWDDGELVGHGAVVGRVLLHGGRPLRCGYVEGVAVRGSRRGRGVGAQIMAALERVIRGAFEVGALGSSDEAVGFYAARGWEVWRGPLSALTPDGVVPTPGEAGGIFVLPVPGVRLDLDAELTCDLRAGDLW